MKMVLFGGTTEGRVLAQKLAVLGVQMTVSVATELGREALSKQSDISVQTGRLSVQQMAQLLASADLCVDATHPYAVEVSANIKTACLQTGVPLQRLLRAESETGKTIRVQSSREAAKYLCEKEGNILLTTGAKQLADFASLAPERVFARVLPTHESIAACENIGLAHKNILALQGPFTIEMNVAMLKQYQITWLVTKDGGAEGGFAEKQKAACAVGANVVLICRPQEQGETMEQIYKSIQEALS